MPAVRSKSPSNLADLLRRSLGGSAGDSVQRAARLRGSRGTHLSLDGWTDRGRAVTKRSVSTERKSDSGSADHSARRRAISPSKGSASPHTSRFADSEDSAAGKGSHLAHAPLERGLGSSCRRVRVSFLDRVWRSGPGFAFGIVRAAGIGSCERAGKGATPELSAGGRKLQRSVRVRSGKRTEACEDQGPAGADEGKRSRSHRRRCYGASFHLQTGAAAESGWGKSRR